MTSKRRFSVPAFLQVGAVGAVMASTTPGLAATWQTGVKYGGTNGMDLYVPDKVDASPAVVVALHYCGGNSGNAHSWLQSEADKYGFVIIAPQAGGNCFDATPARSGERDAITKMVAYVVTNQHADATKVFAAGASSGACMTQALLAAYPEVFAGGSVLAGVPAGAWTGGNAYGWSTPSKTAAEWGDIVRKASPNFTGNRPKIQLWHGTGDTTLTYAQNFPAEVAQWTNVLGVSDSNITMSTWKGPQDSWARNSYKDSAGTLVMETNVAQNAPHDLSGRGLWPEVVRFFGLDSDAPTTGGGGAGGMGGSAGSGTSGGKAGAGGMGGTSVGPGGMSGSGGTGAGGSGGSAGPIVTPAGGSGASGGSAQVATPPTGGASSNGGSTGGTTPPNAGNSSTGLTRDDGGCSVSSTHDQRPSSTLLGLLVASLGAVVRRRRRSPK